MDRKPLAEVYYDPKSSGALGGVERLYRITKKYFTRKQIEDWLQKQDVYTLHKDARRNFPRNKTLVSSIDDVWQMDLVDMRAYKKENDGICYLLTCIDVFSKYAWAIPIRRKTGNEIVEALQILFRNRKPSKIQTDSGSEFYNKKVKDLLKMHQVGLYSTKSEKKAAVVERFNRTLKSRMWRYFTLRGSHRYVDIIDDLIEGYNTAYHRSIKMSPKDVNTTNSEDVRRALYLRRESRSKPRFEVGDQVRISKWKETFDKGYLPNWTEEVFTISKQLSRDNPVYELEDLEHQPIQGSFYKEELQKIHKKDDDFWRIEKVIDERIRGKRRQYLVKWMGYPDHFNQWIDAENIKQLSHGLP